MVRFLTAGESHGRALVVILEGIPAGLPIDIDAITEDLRRRQGGYGRGRRMAIESDRAEILSGVRAGETIGGPIAMSIANRDWVNWQHTMRTTAEPPADAGGARRAPVTKPRPGHADLAGVAKYGRTDVRDVLERASARETAARVAAGAVARQLLLRAGARITSHVFAIGGATLPPGTTVTFDAAQRPGAGRAAALRGCRSRAAHDRRRSIAPGRPATRWAGPSRSSSRAFRSALAATCSGIESSTDGSPRRMMSIPAIKAVGIGLGPEAAARPGSRVHDEILPDPGGERPTGVSRPSNNAGGLEGGVTNGEDLRVSAWMKPISTLMKPLRSVDLTTMGEAAAAIERSDVCAVPAAAVVGEAMVALVLADALIEKFGGDSVAELERSIAAWTGTLREQFTAKSR